MSTDLCVVLAADAVPSGGNIMEAALSFGVACSFPEDFNPLVDRGYIPCAINGVVAGFEYSFEQNEGVPPTSVRLVFSARANYVDYAAAAVAAASVALSSHGALFEDDDSSPLRGEEIRAWLQSVEFPSPEGETEPLRVPVSVVGPRGNSFLQLKLLPVKTRVILMKKLLETVETAMVPHDLRAPNSRFVLLVRDGHEILGVERV